MIQVLLTDDDPFIRESLKLILGMDPEIAIAATCTNGAEAFETIGRLDHVDVVLMDIRMPECDGVEGTRRIKQAYPDVKVLILTTFDDDDYIIEALQSGASGYLLKNIAPDRIVQGIKTVHQGNVLIHPDIAAKLTTFIGAGPSESRGGAARSETSTVSAPSLSEFGLTPSEQSIVEKIADGLSNKEIAQQLYLSEGTVKNYVTEILGKLSLRDRTQIAIFYLKGRRR